jgi:hypothetical protein
MSVTIEQVKAERAKAEKAIEEALLAFWNATGVQPTEVWLEAFDTVELGGADIGYNITVRMPLAL